MRLEQTSLGKHETQNIRCFGFFCAFHYFTVNVIITEVSPFLLGDSIKKQQLSR